MQKIKELTRLNWLNWAFDDPNELKYIVLHKGFTINRNHNQDSKRVCEMYPIEFRIIHFSKKEINAYSSKRGFKTELCRSEYCRELLCKWRENKAKKTE